VGAEVIKMKTKAFSIAILLLVVLAFSGVESAATQQVLVSDAYDETVLVSPAYDEEVLVTPAQDEYNETVPYENLYILQGPNELQDWQDFIYANGIGGWGRWEYFPETFHYEQEIDVPEHTETVVDVPEHVESQLVIEAYDETVTDVPAHYESQEADHDGYSLYGNGEYMRTGNHGLKIYAKLHQGETLHGFVSVPVGNSNPCQSKDWKWVPVTEQVYIPAVTHVEHHDAVYEDVTIPATYKDIIVPATYKDVKVVDEAAHYLVDGKYIVNHPAVPAVYETVHHDAVYETVHHPAVYKDVEVADPVVDEPVKEEAKTIPMEETGVPLLPLGIAALLVFLGLALVGFRRRDE
jgi:hypothetical protein